VADGGRIARIGSGTASAQCDPDRTEPRREGKPASARTIGVAFLSRPDGSNSNAGSRPVSADARLKASHEA
jgi:hypothetical protein